ncbi:PREDICTED: POC1 centriolar protein homolog A-like [Trachymyrmex cornetzi]|uniref:POC1 centriolar protein homolog A-like n=1 Tax=Trachymyrmex cornetzi TaxID=471704 RepID=UPI00084F6A0A|nr:PREDICTED: POC1 centriolar protein homolog A-like [Trachymyrmex cornetzi]
MEQTGRDPREYKYLVGHHSDVTALSFHPIQTNRFVSSSLDKTLRLWRLDICTKTKCEKVEAHESGILDVCYSPNGDLIASASEDSIRVQISEGRHFTKFEGHRSNVRSVQFSPKGDKLVSASDDKSIILWIPLMGNFTKIFTGHTSSVSCVKFSPDGKLLVSCSDDQTIKLWDITSGRCVKTFNDIKAPTRYVEFHPTGTIIGSANEDACIKLYDLRTNSLHQYYPVHTAAVNMVKFHPNGNFMLTASDDSTMKILDLLKSRSIYTLEGHSDNVTCITFSNDGKLFASSGPDRRMRIWKSNNLCEDDRTSDIPQLRSSEYELGNVNEELNSDKREEDTHVKQDQANYLSDKLKKLHLESDNSTRLSAKIMKSKMNMKNIKPSQVDCVGNTLTVVLQQSQTVLHNQTSSNAFSSDRIKTVQDKILDKIQLLRFHYNVLQQRLVIIEKALWKLDL